MKFIQCGLGAWAMALRSTALAGLAAASPTNTGAVLEQEPQQPGDWQRRWTVCLAEVAAKHPGVPLAPKDELLPLGPCPKSALQEFAFLPSGVPPSRDPSGALEVRPGGAMVLVLVPPDPDFVVGAQSTDPKKRRFDRLAVDSRSAPMASAPMQAFLVSKYELTLGQWRRLRKSAGESLDDLGPSDNELLPVTRVSPAELMVGLAAAGLTLPSEAEWEYAARAGTDTPWWTGESAESVTRVGNEYISAAQVAVKGASTWDEAIAILDREYFPRPVGLSNPNPFGLFDIHGNVREVCDSFYRPDQPLRGVWAADPMAATSVVLAKRGGCYATVSTDWVRTVSRGGVGATSGSPTVGARPILRLARGAETR